MDTNSFSVHIITEDMYEDIAKDVEKRFDTSNYELERPLPKERNKKVIGLMTDELGEEIMKEFVGLRARQYSYDEMMTTMKARSKSKVQNTL